MKNYLIIGGSSGIGKALTAELATAHNVYASYYNNPIPNTDKTHYFHIDVTQEEFNLDMLPNEIHGLAYCPGSINLKPFHRLKPSQFMTDYNFQVVGAIKVIQAVLPKLKNSSSASIVLFSTVAVQTGIGFHSMVSASKGAIEGLTRALAAELAPNIRVNAIAPSLTHTSLAERFINTPEKKQAQTLKNPLKKLGAPKDVANAAAFLLTSKSSWITGQVIHIDGGFGTINQ